MCQGQAKRSGAVRLASLDRPANASWHAPCCATPMRPRSFAFAVLPILLALTGCGPAPEPSPVLDAVVDGKTLTFDDGTGSAATPHAEGVRVAVFGRWGYEDGVADAGETLVAYVILDPSRLAAIASGSPRPFDVTAAYSDRMSRVLFSIATGTDPAVRGAGLQVESDSWTPSGTVQHAVGTVRVDAFDGVHLRGALELTATGGLPRWADGSSPQVTASAHGTFDVTVPAAP